jgi:hypothetical protein
MKRPGRQSGRWPFLILARRSAYAACVSSLTVAICFFITGSTSTTRPVVLESSHPPVSNSGVNPSHAQRTRGPSPSERPAALKIRDNRIEMHLFRTDLGREGGNETREGTRMSASSSSPKEFRNGFGQLRRISTEWAIIQQFFVKFDGRFDWCRVTLRTGPEGVLILARLLSSPARDRLLHVESRLRAVHHYTKIAIHAAG